MSRRIALALCDVATRTLPASRRRWGEGMKAELDHIADDRAATRYAAGCVLAGLRVRSADFGTRFALGSWSLALITAGFAMHHLLCGWRGVRILMGGHDPLLDILQQARGADQALSTAYLAARPLVAACFVLLGLAHLAVAIFLSRAQYGRVLAAWCAALLIALVAVVVQLSVIWTLDGLPSEFFALLVQALLVPALLLWSNGRHRSAAYR